VKCPKCGYLGFERVERCRNCGYDFPVTGLREIPELPLRGADDPVGLPDLELVSRAVSARMVEARSAVPAEDELPLFGAIAPDVRLVGPTPSPRPPLAVRRATPEVRRVRFEQPRAPLLDLGTGETDTRTAFPSAARREVPPALRPVATDVVGHGTRLAAGIVDLLLLAAIDLLVISLTLQICSLTVQDLGVLPAGPLLAFLILQNGGYLAAFTAGGQTLGKMALGLRVVPDEGRERVSPARAALRTLVWGLMALPLGLGFASVLLDREGRGWHDRAAGTRVVPAGEA
jgi:uncharacterized RDD family membrane protein YckC